MSGQGSHAFDKRIIIETVQRKKAIQAKKNLWAKMFEVLLSINVKNIRTEQCVGGAHL